MNRYSSNWAWYLGHHWAYRREMGDSQLTFNYVKALADYLINFSFGAPIHFGSPEATSAIIPHLLKKVWDQDNDGKSLRWEIGQLGAISGDVFVKVAFEPPYVDPAGNPVAAKIRILPLNPAHVFPEFHPHDRSRFTRVKVKYKFFGTAADGTRQVHTYTELITDEMIEEYINDELIDSRPNPLGVIPIAHGTNIAVASSPWGLSDIQDIISLNREFNEKATEVSDIINYHCVDPETEALTRSGWRRHDELSPGDEILCLDPDSDEILWRPIEALNVWDYDGPMVHWDNRIDALTTPNHRWLAERRIGRPENARFERQFVRTSEGLGDEVAASDLREGSKLVLGGGVPAHFPTVAKYDDEFVETVAWFVTEGCYGRATSGTRYGTISQSEKVNPGYVADLSRLGSYWGGLGATFSEQKNGRTDGVRSWYLGVDVLSSLDEVAPDKAISPEFLCSLTYQQARLFHRILVDADGTRYRGREVWYQDDQDRRDAFQMLSAMLGGHRTRSFENGRGDGVVDTYQSRTTEVLSTVRRAKEVHNESGIVWCPTVETGVWFARRNGSTYWTGNSAPVTVVTGAKASNLEKGPRKVWAIGNKDARVQNLSMDTNLSGPLGYMEMIKTAMHEMTGVPMTALGQLQPISNTSGTSLHMQFFSLMQRHTQKQVQYSKLFKKINELVIRTAAFYEPEWLEFNVETASVPPKPDQYMVCDPRDPATYRSTVEWGSPLPLDALIKLNEVQAKMTMGLESKRGAIKEMGHSFPDQKLQEIFEELMEDQKQQGALSLTNAQIQQFVIAATGMTSDGQPLIIPGMDQVDDQGNPTGVAPAINPEIANEVMMHAYGLMPPQRDNYDED